MASGRINVLDHGFVRLVEHMGSDLSIVRAARVSYNAAWRAGRLEGFAEAQAELSHRAFLCHTHNDFGRGRERGLLDAMKYIAALSVTPEPPSEKENEGD